MSTCNCEKFVRLKYIKVNHIGNASESENERCLVEVKINGNSLKMLLIRIKIKKLIKINGIKEFFFIN